MGYLEDSLLKPKLTGSTDDAYCARPRGHDFNKNRTPQIIHALTQICGDFMPINIRKRQCFEFIFSLFLILGPPATWVWEFSALSGSQYWSGTRLPLYTVIIFILIDYFCLSNITLYLKKESGNQRTHTYHMYIASSVLTYCYALVASAYLIFFK